MASYRIPVGTGDHSLPDTIKRFRAGPHTFHLYLFWSDSESLLYITISDVTGNTLEAGLPIYIGRNAIDSDSHPLLQGFLLTMDTTDVGRVKGDYTRAELGQTVFPVLTPPGGA